MSLTQQEQIKQAKKAYIMNLVWPRDGMGTARFAVYLDREGALSVLWPGNPNDYKSELLTYQVHSNRRQYPAFHFALSGCGYSKIDEIRRELEKVNPEISCYSINGYNPSLL